METDDESDDEVVVEKPAVVKSSTSCGCVLESEEAALLRDATQRAMVSGQDLTTLMILRMTTVRTPPTKS